LWPSYYVGSFTDEIELSPNQNSTKLQNILPLPLNLKDRIAAVVNDPNTDCAEFIKKLISEAEKIDGKALSSNPLILFERVQNQAGFELKNMPYGGATDRKGNKRVVYINPVSKSSDSNVNDHSQNAYAVTALNELMHHARKTDFYLDRTLAQAIFRLLTPTEQQAAPLPKSKNEEVNSEYFHPLFKKHCKSPTGQ
jgi:hypothetical protein